VRCAHGTERLSERRTSSGGTGGADDAIPTLLYALLLGSNRIEPRCALDFDIL